MLYLLYARLAEHHHYVPILNLLKYLTFRSGMSLATAQIVVVSMGSRFIRWMQTKQGKGQPIRTDGIQRHIIEKAGTPTMGGLMILAGLMVGTLIWADLSNVYVWVAILVTGSFGVLGFLDDYAKVTKQTTEGVSSLLRLGIEFLVALVAVFAMVRMTISGPPAAGFTHWLMDVVTLHQASPQSTSLAFPIFKSLLFNLGWFYLIFAGVVIVGAANAVNFTDGLDGLAIVPVMIAAATFAIIAYLVGNFVFAEYLKVHFVPGVGELAVFCGSIIGAGLGFLWYNAPPAKIFMGDTGSLALGGALGTVAVACKHEIVLAIVGGLFVAEALSVIIQVAYFKRTGRRVFLMAPIHHHFEKLGWAESTVVVRFWIVAIVLALIGLATLKLR
jgi:phospho-N-acetylmuramoyl-pentapeptide-transferase